MKKLLITSVAKAAAKDSAPFHTPHHSKHTPPLTFPLQASVRFCKHTAFLCNRCLPSPTASFSTTLESMCIFFVCSFTAFVS